MRIGMIGLGAMGLPIAKRLLGAGHELCAFDLSPRAVGEAEAAGARICPTAGEAAADTEVDVYKRQDGEGPDRGRQSFGQGRQGCRRHRPVQGGSAL